MTRGRRYGLLGGALVLLVVLGWLLWPTDGSGAVVLRTNTSRYAVELSVAHPSTPSSEVRVRLTGSDGRPATVDSVRVSPAMPSMGHTDATTWAYRFAPGAYRAADVRFVMAGQWNVTVLLRDGQQTERATFPVLIKG